MKTLFQRPDVIKQPLDVIVTLFNSARFRNRWKHYQDFVAMAERAGNSVRLWTVEVAFGNRAFVSDASLRLRTSYELWHKERSQNLLLQYVLSQQPDAQYIAFVDADISFIRYDWADETRHALQHYDVVQMWREAYDLDADGHVIQQHRSFASCHQDGSKMPVDDYYGGGRKIVYWHPGYAWAWRRSALDSVGGLIDWAILGSADFHQAHALVGQVGKTLKRRLSKAYANAMRAWQTRAERGIKRNIGCVPGSIFHHWHGPKAARRYKSRWRILEDTAFDQSRDLVRDAQGLYQLQHHGTDRSSRLRDAVRNYFHSRNEDAS